MIFIDFIVYALNFVICVKEIGAGKRILPFSRLLLWSSFIKVRRPKVERIYFQIYGNVTICWMK